MTDPTIAADLALDFSQAHLLEIANEAENRAEILRDHNRRHSLRSRGASDPEIVDAMLTFVELARYCRAVIEMAGGDTGDAIRPIPQATLVDDEEADQIHKAAAAADRLLQPEGTKMPSTRAKTRRASGRSPERRLKSTAWSDDAATLTLGDLLDAARSLFDPSHPGNPERDAQALDPAYARGVCELIGRVLAERLGTGDGTAENAVQVGREIGLGAGLYDPRRDRRWRDRVGVEAVRVDPDARLTPSEITSLKILVANGVALFDEGEVEALKRLAANEQIGSEREREGYDRR